MTGVFLTNQLIAQGLVRGLIYAVLALGIVLVYRATRVINFAVGSLGVPVAAVLAIMVQERGWPYWPSLVFTLALGALAGSVVEVLFIRRLSTMPRVMVLIGTLGVAEVAQWVYTTIPFNKSGQEQLSFAQPWDKPWDLGHGVVLRPGDVLSFVLVPIATALLWIVLTRTPFGERVRAVATNTDLARMTGISPKLVANAVWAISGCLSALTAVLVFTTQPGTFNELAGGAIGLQTLLRGLTAALIARMRSFPVAFGAAIAIGLADSLLEFHFTQETGLLTFVLFAAVLVLVAVSSRHDDTGGESFTISLRAPQLPDRFRDVWWARRSGAMLAALAFAVAAILPLLIDSPSKHMTWARIIGFCLCTASVVVLTGWGGQLSLGQMAFAGIGALTASAAARGFELDIGWHNTRLVNGALRGVAFPYNILIGALAATAVAMFIGLLSLRVRGLLLGIATIAFAVTAAAYLFRRPFFTEGRPTVDFPRADLGPFEFTNNNRAYYYFTLVVATFALLWVGRLRRSGIGRSIIGVRENEQAASAMTVSPLRAKITAFAVAGFLAGLGGGLIATTQGSLGPTEQNSLFLAGYSLTVVAVAVIGGVSTLSGAVVGGAYYLGLKALFPGNEKLLLFTSSIGLLLVLLYFPGGLTRIAFGARDHFLRWLERRLPARPPRSTVDVPASLAVASRREAPPTNEDGSTLRAIDVTVRFGGNVAVDQVNFEARPGEVVGLIGTNGAGKSTLLNAICGFVASNGTIELFGTDVSQLPPHRRARLGLGRTFQAATLYPDLTVRDTVQLALEARHRTSFWATMLFDPRAVRVDRTRRREADELIAYLGLGRYADRYVGELSTGTRRIVELCAVLAVGPSVLCFDEPTAGVAQREAEAFGPMIKRIQRELDAAIVIVEHDMPMIMGISDRVYCLEAGRVIASGSPATVRNDPLVIASYLGTDERAIARSDSR